MTRKHYVSLAEDLNSLRKCFKHNKPSPAAQWDILLDVLASWFKRDNPNFDTAKWFEAINHD